MNPLISIIIPIYNRAGIICQTLDSLLKQSYINWQCILIDDISTDNTLDLIKEYTQKDKRFVNYSRPTSKIKGPSTCRNIGLKKAKGDYIIFLDSDDVLANFCIEQRVNAFKQNLNCDFLVFKMERFLDVPNNQKQSPLEIISNKDNLFKFLHLNSIWQVTSPIYKRSFLEKLKGFNELLLNFEDVEFAIKSILLAKNYKRFNNIDSFYRNDINYKLKYKKKETKKKTVTAFIIFLSSINNQISNLSDAAKIISYKKQIVIGYQRLFLLNMKDDIADFRLLNNSILTFLTNEKYLSNKQKVKFYFVKNIVSKFHKFKGIGVYRFMKLIYKIE